MTRIFYECDGRQCQDCYSECFYTTDIQHAKNFTKHKGRNEEPIYVENDEKWGMKMTKQDLVCHPSHYTRDGVETIDKMQAIFGEEGLITICKANCFKYLDRYRYKGNGLQDLSKAYWYATKCLVLLTDSKEDYSFDIKHNPTNKFGLHCSNAEYYVYKAKLQIANSEVDQDNLFQGGKIDFARDNIARAYRAYEQEHSNENC